MFNMMDFAKIGEIIPKLEGFAADVVKTVVDIRAEQKAHHELLKKIAEKVGIEVGDVLKIEGE